MDVRQYTKKPRVLSGVTFDGTRTSADEISEWVRSATGMQMTLVGKNRLYVPTPAGTQVLNEGDTLLMDGDVYYPISPDDLDVNYDDTTDPPIEQETP